MSVRASNLVRGHESQKFHHGATLAGHSPFRLRSTISVHKFRSLTTSVDISSPRNLVPRVYISPRSGKRETLSKGKQNVTIPNDINALGPCSYLIHYINWLRFQSG